MYTGLTGKLMIGTQEIAYISNWSVEDTTDIIEMTSLGDKFKTKEAGLQSWSASADGAVIFNDIDAKKGHTLLFSAKHGRTPIICKFYLDTAIYFEGTGLIESLSVDLSAEDKGNISISISGDGELSYPV